MNFYLNEDKILSRTILLFQLCDVFKNTSSNHQPGLQQGQFPHHDQLHCSRIHRDLERIGLHLSLLHQAGNIYC